MTLHTRAATDDILDIFNQPLRNIGQIDADADSGPDSDDDDDEDEDDYTSGGESTATGRISGATSEFGDDTGVQSEPAPDSTEVKSVSDWSDFTKSKHVPKVPGVNDDEDDETHQTDASGQVEVTQDDLTTEDGAQLQTPVSPKFTEEVHTRFIPIPPEDYEAPTHPYRDAAQIEQNRLPFMTPIVEKTESSITMPSARNAQRDYFNSKTPSRHRAEDPALPEIENLLISSPLQEIVKEAAPVSRETKPIATAKPVAKKQAGPIIKDLQCNPVDESIRATILESIDPPLFSFAGFHDHSDTAFGRGSEIRKFVKALCKPSSNSEKTTSITTQPIIRFPSITNYEYIIKRELGKGAYAPVYLTEQIPISSDDTSDSDESKEVASTLLALKSEHPPSPWEFYIMETLHSRLAASHTISRATESLAKPHSLHLFSDECYLLESYHPHGTLLDLINLSKTPDAPPLDECLSMFFTVELLRTIESLHSVSILHGDIKADNCLLRLPSISDSDWANRYAANGDGMWSAKGLVLIDFGRGIDMSQFSKDVGFLADWKTDTMDCREMRTLRPWTGQIDYFAVAGLVHLLLLGRWIDECEDKSSTLSSRGVGMEEEGKDDDNNGEGKVDERQDMTIGINLTKTKRFKVKEPLKRYWQVELWSSLFDVLLNPTLYVSPQGGGRGNVVMIPEKLAEVRKKFEAYLEENSEKKGLKNGLRRWEERLGRRR